MSQPSDRSGPARNGPRAGERLFTPASDSVFLRVFFSESFPNAVKDIDVRMHKLLQDTDVVIGVTWSQILLVGMQRPITPREWTRILDWLMRQPEVEFAVRTFPPTIRVGG